MLTEELLLRIDVAIEFHVMGALAVEEVGEEVVVKAPDGTRRPLIRYGSDPHAADRVIAKLSDEGWQRWVIQEVDTGDGDGNRAQWAASAAFVTQNALGRERVRTAGPVTADTRELALALLALVQINEPLAHELGLLD